VPAEQVPGGWHTLPQTPQFWESVCVLVHVPLQSVRPAMQAHLPEMQTSPLAASHLTPHVPQWSLLD